jgi:hypothetical protein
LKECNEFHWKTDIDEEGDEDDEKGDEVMKKLMKMMKELDVNM